jgi:outer membrane protein assembly factor BamB
MNTASSRIALALACSISAATSLAQAWPQWRGPNRDGQAAFQPPSAWPGQWVQTWDVAVGEGDATPALLGNKLFVFARQDGREVTRCLDAATPVVHGQSVIYTGAGRGTRAIQIAKPGDQFKVTELWANPDIAVQYNSPVLSGGSIFGLSQNGDLFCLNAKDGSTARTAPTGDRGGFGTIVNAGSVLLLLTPKAELIVFPPDPKEYKPLATQKVATSETYAYPVVSGHRIFVKDQDGVALWTVN